VTDTIKFGIGAILAIAYVAGLVVLVWHGSITGSEAVGAAGAVVLPIVGAAIHGSGAQIGAQAASGTPVTTTTHRGLPE
jgi:hypothetical protein